jgi:hypothetical protein
MTLLGGEREISEIEVDYSGIHPGRNHVSGRLQEEAAATAAPTATTAPVAHCIHLSEPEQR